MSNHVFECGCECYDAGTTNAVTFSCEDCTIVRDPVTQWFGVGKNTEKNTRVVNRCSTCGIARNAKMFSLLPLVGNMGDGDGGQLELRNCVCGSTISIPTQ